jgi:hypothetical protein
MIVRAVPSAPRLVGPTTRHAICYVAPSYRVVASANRACERSAVRCCTIAAGLHVLHVMITLSAHMSCSCLGNT